MNKILMVITCFFLVAVNPVIAQANLTAKSEQKEQKIHACCKAKGGAENCCKKGLVFEKNSQCSKKDCQGACCKNKVTEKMNAPTCCKAKGGLEQCCKKGMDANTKTQCNKKQCATNCCKNKVTEDKPWWKVW